MIRKALALVLLAASPVLAAPVWTKLPASGLPTSGPTIVQQDGKRLVVSTFGESATVKQFDGSVLATLTTPSTAGIYGAGFDPTASAFILTGTDSTTDIIATYWYSPGPGTAWTARTLAASGIIGDFAKGTTKLYFSARSTTNTLTLLEAATVASNPSLTTTVSSDTAFDGQTRIESVSASCQIVAGTRSDNLLTHRGYDNGSALYAETDVTVFTGSNFFGGQSGLWPTQSLAMFSVIENGAGNTTILSIDCAGASAINQDLSGWWMLLGERPYAPKNYLIIKTDGTVNECSTPGASCFSASADVPALDCDGAGTVIGASKAYDGVSLFGYCSGGDGWTLSFDVPVTGVSGGSDNTATGRSAF